MYLQKQSKDWAITMSQGGLEGEAAIRYRRSFQKVALASASIFAIAFHDVLFPHIFCEAVFRQVG